MSKRKKKESFYEISPWREEQEPTPNPFLTKHPRPVPKIEPSTQPRFHATTTPNSPLARPLHHHGPIPAPSQRQKPPPNIRSNRSLTLLRRTILPKPLISSALTLPKPKKIEFSGPKQFALDQKRRVIT